MPLVRSTRNPSWDPDDEASPSFNGDARFLTSADLIRNLRDPLIPYVAEIPVTRAWRHDDLDLLRDSASLYAPEWYPQRFLAGGRRLRPLHDKVTEQLAAPERYWTGQVAVTGHRMVALAECVWAGAGVGSPMLTVNVADAWQGSGLAQRTLGELVGRCVTLGLTTFNVDYAASNVPITSMMSSIAAQTEARCSVREATPAGIGHVTVRAAG